MRDAGNIIIAELTKLPVKDEALTARQRLAILCIP